jgi:hypothetical protein
VPAARDGADPGAVVSFEAVPPAGPAAIAPSSTERPARERRERAPAPRPLLVPAAPRDAAPVPAAPRDTAPAPAAPRDTAPAPAPAPAAPRRRPNPPPAPPPVVPPPAVTPPAVPAPGRVVEQARRAVDPVVEALPAPVREPVDGVVDVVEGAAGTLDETLPLP